MPDFSGFRGLRGFLGFLGIGSLRRDFLWLKILFAIVTGLVGAALLHLIIIFSLPQFSQHDAYTRIIAEGESHRFYRLGEKPDRAGLAKEDPMMETAVCSFDISDAPVRLAAPNGGVPFWSLGVFDASSDEVFSINDRTSADHVLDVVIGTPAQLAVLRKSLPRGFSQTVLVESQQTEGYAVLRGLVTHQSVAPAVSQFFDQATCAPFQWRTRGQP
ncbi:DUF1254 domain-containing protein [Neorhizobium sp. NCHU2750]|uniref:DUF1254 domain-containing protein n=1 Tax=Neorhizobium sp. NCHU2750 TaxID=1825976 RepID=UPI000E75BF9A|nr:membrane protein [Neorhizobium sp. NCHU2750]